MITQSESVQKTTSVRLSFSDGYWYIDKRVPDRDRFVPDSIKSTIEAAMARIKELMPDSQSAQPV